MKHSKLLSIASLFIGASIAPQINAAIYSGNGNLGFGGAIGASSLEITDDGTSLFFGLTRGSSDLTDVSVLYLNSQTGGLSDNTTVVDETSIYRQAISGCAGGNCVDINFGFDADYAITFDAQEGALLFGLNGNGSLNFISILGGSGLPSDSSYSFGLPLAAIGLPDLSGQNIEFIGTYINASTAFLSNEGYGAGLPTSNPGSSPVAFTGSELYETSTVPVPTAVWLFGSGILSLIGFARCKKV